MESDDLYVPMHQLVKEKEKAWTFTNINLPYNTIVARGIVMWCVNNLKGRWTMLGGNKFGFEDGADAMIFKIQFDVQ